MSAVDEPWKDAAAEPLHPLLMADVKTRQSRPPLSSLEPADARRRFRALQAGRSVLPPTLGMRDGTVPSRRGDIAVRIYEHSDFADEVALFFHGGGFVQGDIDTHERVAIRLAVALQANVVSVAYSLGPERPFPAATDDAIDASRFVAENATAFGARSGRVLVTGDSAGATLAIVAALELGREAAIRPAGLVALYPVLDFTRVGETPSYRRSGYAGMGLSTDDMLWFRRHYAPNPSEWTDWRCSPLFASDLSLLPPTLLLVGAHDVLYSENHDFAAKLVAEGVPLQFTALPDANHGFLLPETLIPSAETVLANLRRSLDTLR